MYETLCSNAQIYGGDVAKFCGLLRIYELYRISDVSLLLENQGQKTFKYLLKKICEFIENEV